MLVGDWDALTAEGGLLPGLVSGIEADFTEFVDTSDALEVIEGIFEALGLLTLIPMLKAAFAGVDMIVTTVEEIKSPLLNLMSTATDWGNSWSDLSGLDTDLTLENAAGKILSSFMNNIDGIVWNPTNDTSDMCPLLTSLFCCFVEYYALQWLRHRWLV